MNYVWIVEEEGYDHIWWPLLGQYSFDNREDARDFVKERKGVWAWEKLRVRKYIRVD